MKAQTQHPQHDSERASALQSKCPIYVRKSVWNEHATRIERGPPENKSAAAPAPEDLTGTGALTSIRWLPFLVRAFTAESMKARGHPAASQGCSFTECRCSVYGIAAWNMS